MTNKTKSTGMAYLLLVLAGVFGVHRFYLNKPLTGILFLLTFGFGGFGILLDLLLIPSMVEAINGKLNPTLKTETAEEKLARWETKLDTWTTKMDHKNKESKAKSDKKLEETLKTWKNRSTSFKVFAISTYSTILGLIIVLSV